MKLGPFDSAQNLRFADDIKISDRHAANCMDRKRRSPWSLCLRRLPRRRRPSRQLRGHERTHALQKKELSPLTLCNPAHMPPRGRFGTSAPEPFRTPRLGRALPIQADPSPGRYARAIEVVIHCPLLDFADSVIGTGPVRSERAHRRSACYPIGCRSHCAWTWSRPRDTPSSFGPA